MMKRNASNGEKRVWAGFSFSIYAAFLLFVSMLLLIFISYMIRQNRSVVETNVMNGLCMDLEQKKNALMREIEDACYLSDMVYLDNSIRNLHYQTNEDAKENASDILQYFSILNAINDSIRYFDHLELKLYVNDKALMANEQRLFYPVSEIEGEPWYQRAAQRPLINNWFCWDKPMENEKTLACIRLTKADPSLAILVKIKKEVLDSVLVNPYGDNGGMTCLFDGTQIILSRNGDADETQLLETVEGLPKADNERVTVEIDGQRYLCTCVEIDHLNWALFSMVPYGIIGNMLKTSIVSSYSALIVVMFIMVVLAVILAETFSRRIRGLVKHMENIEKEGFSYQFRARRMDEIGLIEYKFNEMSLRIHNMIEEIQNTNKMRREAELRSLRAQINPHFLYNTLDSINWLAITRGQYDISKIISTLGSFYRMSMTNDKDVVTIEEEIELSRKYAQIQTLRNGDMLKISFDVEPECRPKACIKLLIQPLLENAIKYNMLRDGRVLTIHVEISCLNNGRLQLLVTDNGRGLKEAEEIKSSLKIIQSGYGLKNVQQRMMFYFGEDVYLALYDNPRESGTCVQIIWNPTPVVKDGAMI